MSGLQRRIDETGFGKIQIFSILLCGSLFMHAGAFRVLFDHSSLSLQNSLIANHPVLFPLFLNFAFFIGAACSAGTSLFGRRPAIVLSLLLCGLCSYAASVSPNQWGAQLETVLSFLGLGLGIPPSLCLVLELASSRMKGMSIALLLLFSCIGELFCVCMLTIYPNSSFQLGMEYLSVPLVIAAVVAAIALPESPSVLTEDCYLLNATLSAMGANSRFFPAPVTYVEADRFDANRSIFGLASVVAGIEFFSHKTLAKTDSIQSALSVSLLSLASLLLAGGLLSANLFSPKTLLAISLFAGSVLAGAGVALPSRIESSLVFTILKALSFAILTFALTCAGLSSWNPATRIKLFAGMFGFGNLLSFLPLLSGQGTTLAALFGLLTVLVLVFVSDQTSIDCDSNSQDSLYHRGKFGKIPVLDPPPLYGSI